MKSKLICSSISATGIIIKKLNLHFILCINKINYFLKYNSFLLCYTFKYYIQSNPDLTNHSGLTTLFVESV